MSVGQLVLLTNMIAPYRVPLFNEIARQHSEFHVIFLSHREVYRSWDIPDNEIDFSYEVLKPPKGFLGNAIHSLFRFNPYVLQALRRAYPETLIIGGWNYVENWLGLLCCKALGIPVVLWSGAIDSSSRYTGIMTNTVRRLFVMTTDAAVSYGTSAARMLQRYGADPDRIAVGCNVGDVAFYYQMVNSFRQTASYREEYLQWPRPLFLYVGQLVSRKGLQILLKAFESLDMPNEWGLVIVGTGPDDGNLRQYCMDHGLANVFFAGFQQRGDLIRSFALADVFVLPSLREQGAIVLSEALASGLYVLASVNDGIAPDFIVPGKNGDFIDPASIPLLANQLQELIQQYRHVPWDPDELSREFMKTQPIQRYAAAFLVAMHLAQQNHLRAKST